MTKIIVIGAGVSGIAAATKLLENGFRNLLVLEGESRIGGRVHTIPFASNVVDLGAQWCHGEKDNVVFQLANPHGFFSSATTKYDNFACIKSNGDVVDEKISSRLCEMAIGILEGNKDELKTYLGSLGSFIVEKYGKLLETEQYKDIDKNTAYQFLDFFHRYENSIEASDTWYDTSARGYLHYWDCDGDRLLNWKDRGYKTILDLLMKKIPNPTNAFDIEDKILLNKTVTKIDYGRNDGFVNVQCADGTSYLANHVISTVSLGVLKENYLSMFEPALPRYKVNAIQGLGIGTVDKIYLEFEKPFWSDNWQGFSLLWEQSDMEEVKKRSAWLQDVFGFYIVDFQPNILCGWISGPRARMMEMASEDEIRRDVMFLLRKFLKTDVPEPKRVLTSSWYSNPHFRGSYSFRSVTTDLLQTSAADLAKPLTNSQGVPILQFAGEATHDHYYSTVHGALETGWREAGRIIDFYKRPLSNL
ncbi:spermine oxidase-like [Culicoides brevitarsis]|uniref:spermine oxidase-like n=1 Tax=Culicoides brevitarsis TaxID=469753 RepID=UPI00307B4677